MADMRHKIITEKDCIEQALDKLASYGAVWDGVDPRELRGDSRKEFIRRDWTPDKPTNPGWYWFILSDSPIVLHVRPKGGGGLCAFFPVRGWTPIEDVEDSLWAGPIIPPAMPEK